MTTLFIADLHLEDSRPEIAGLFFKFLKEEAYFAKALYILGDLFEVWVGDDDASPFNESIIRALAQTAKHGTEIYLMHGNRDFLIGKRFCRAASCQLLPDEKLLDLNGEPTLLMHGDTLCTRDEKYLRFRKKSRRFLVQKLFLMKALAKRKEMAKQARKMSEMHTRGTQAEIMDVTQAEVERIMLRRNSRHLIHGHTHRPAVHEFQLKGESAKRTVLAPWHEQGSALMCHADGRQEFIEIT